MENISKRLTAFEFWVVAFSVLISMIWPTFLPAAIAISAFFWLIRLVGYRKLTTRTAADPAVFILLFMLAVSLWITPVPDRSAVQVYRVITGIALFYASANWANTNQRLETALNGITIAGLMLVLVAPLSVEWAFGKLPISFDLYNRFILIITDTIHPNVFAGVLVIFFPIILAQPLFRWSEMSWFFRLLSLLTTSMMLGFTALAQSRGALMSMGLTTLIVLMLHRKLRWVSLALIILMAVAGLYFYFGNPAGYFSAAIIRSAGVDQRSDIWLRAMLMIEDFPWTGIGMGAFPEVVDSLYPFYPPAEGEIPHAHNVFLQVAVDLGIPGLIAWTAILITTIYSSWKVFRHGAKFDEAFAMAIGAGLLCSQIGLVAHGMLDAPLWGMVRPAPLVWVTWGLAAAARHTLVEDPD